MKTVAGFVLWNLVFAAGLALFAGTAFLLVRAAQYLASNIYVLHGLTLLAGFTALALVLGAHCFFNRHIDKMNRGKR